MKAVKCPVCGGLGHVEVGPHDTTNAAPRWARCLGCGGRGWVEVEEAT
mgnify:CR=1 FL=1